MAAAYDLFVLLDPEVPEDRRTALVEQVKSQIASRGADLKGDADWGMRRLSYEIDHRREAQYHLFQFEGPPEALSQLDRALSIEDGVLRHRIIRLPGSAPETTPGPTEESSRRPSDERPPRADGERREEAAEEGAGEAEPASTAEAPSVSEPETGEAPSGEAPAAAAEPAGEPAEAAAEPAEAAAPEAVEPAPEQAPDETA